MTSSTPQPMGPGGYREKHGQATNAEMIAAVREHLGRNHPGVTLTDAQILEAIGWAYAPGSAIRKTERWLESNPQHPYPRMSAAERTRQVVAILVSLAPASQGAVEHADLAEVARRANCSRYAARWAVLYASTAVTEEGVAVYLDDLDRIELRRGAKLTIRSDDLRPWSEPSVLHPGAAPAGQHQRRQDDRGLLPGQRQHLVPSDALGQGRAEGHGRHEVSERLSADEREVLDAVRYLNWRGRSTNNGQIAAQTRLPGRRVSDVTTTLRARGLVIDVSPGDAYHWRLTAEGIRVLHDGGRP